MKCRLPTPEERLKQQREKGRNLIRQMREKGYSDKEICEKLGVPKDRWNRFLIQIGMPFAELKDKKS
jgi:hypothetical protein